MAIALDTAKDGGNNGGTANNWSFSHTCTGTNLILFVGFCGDSGGGADDVTGVTYNSVAMTLIQKNVGAAQDRFTYLYYIVNPATGAHNVQINCTASHYILAGSASYTGAAQSGQPDNSNQQQSASSATTLTSSLTTVADQCWNALLHGSYGGGSSNSPTASTGSTRRAVEAAFGSWGLFDSNSAKTPAGSVSMTTTQAGTTGNVIRHSMSSFKPFVAGVAKPGRVFSQAINRLASF